MRKSFTPLVLAASLVAGTGYGCGNPEVAATINGYAQGTDVFIVEDQWVPHYGEDTAPEGTVRNQQATEQFDGCVEVDDEFFEWNFDDPDCFFSLCSSSETTHCEARYKYYYDYEAFEPVTVDSCPAPIRRSEFKPPDSRDTRCEEELMPHQRLQKVSRFFIWVSSPNPDYDEGEPRTISGVVEVTPQEYARAERGTNITAEVLGLNIVDIQIAA